MRSLPTTLATAAACLLLAMGATACSGGEPTDDTTDATHGSTSEQPAQEATDAVEYDTVYEVATPRIGQDAVARFGENGAKQGTDAAIDIVEVAAFNPDLVAAERPAEQGALLALGEKMTPETAKEWNGVVDKYANGTPAEAKDATTNLFSLTFYDALQDDAIYKGKPMVFPTDSPAAANPKITSVRTSVSTDDRLEVTVNSSGDLRTLVGSEPYTTSVTRSATFWLVQSGGEWKIDAWKGSFHMVHTAPEK